MPARYSSHDLQPKEVFAAAASSVYVLLAGPSSGAMEKGVGALGSAVAVSETSAVTNCHLMRGNPFIALIDDDTNQVFAAKVVGADERSDRCLLRVEGKLKAIAGVRPAAGLMVGERVYTIGNPSGLTKTLGEGLISGLRTSDGITYVQTSAPISKGSSGGALVDARGALVGVTTFLLKDAQSLNFAIAAEEFWR
jgi:S1-C subfamily serine protease